MRKWKKTLGEVLRRWRNERERSEAHMGRKKR
jgi:hypothetical protein